MATVVDQKVEKAQDQELPPLELTVRGRTYDLTNWGPSHPGGPLLYLYHGRDCTNVFDAFHQHGETRALLEKFPSRPSTLPEPKQDSETIKAMNDGKPVNPRAILEDFNLLTKELHDKGLFKSNPLWFAYKLFTTFAMAPIAYWFNLQGYPWIGCFILATMWQQFGWISHEINHHSVFPQRWQGHDMGWVTGNVMLGFSMWWWNVRHYAHHAVTNLDTDPDIDTLPFLAFSDLDVQKSSPQQLNYIQYQHIYFWAILPFLNIIWGLNSIVFGYDVLAGWTNGHFNKPEQIYTKYNFVERIGLAIHHIGLFLFLITSLEWYMVIPWWFVCKMIAGTGLAFVVFFNHYSCPKFDMDSDAGENFVINQLITTRNLTPGHIADWICGGLNYQVEHHLWPTMPRHNLYKCSLILKPWCEKHNLPYLCSDFVPGVLQVRDYLKVHADTARKLVQEGQKKAM